MNQLEKLAAKGLEVVGAHQRGAALAVADSDLARAAVRQLLTRGLHHLSAAHHQGAGQAARNRDLATNTDLRETLQQGVEANLNQALRLEKVFASTGLPPGAAPYQAMQGIIDDNQAANAEATGLALDLQLVSSGQLAAYLYISTYGTLRSYAQLLGFGEAADLLQQTIDETLLVDANFTRLAHQVIIAAA